MRRTAVIDTVALTPRLLPGTPRLSSWAARGKTASVRAVTPAVTCPVQATYLTGVYPETHGIVANGWYFRDECEVRFWRQSHRLIQAPDVWAAARRFDPSFTSATLFWWFNMYSSADVSVTPRPIYTADGRKIPDLYTRPNDLRDELQRRLGRFPLFNFWGPAASIRSSRWIADAARYVEERFCPTLALVYLPHLDYNLQRLGPYAPEIRRDLLELDEVCATLIDFYEGRGVQVVVLSEYGMAPVSRPVHINRLLRERGLIAVREELGRELLDAGASAAFAVADHQVAHIYVNDRSRLSEVRGLLEDTQGVERVLDTGGKQSCRLDHPRAGELVAVAAPDAWFTYYYWLDDRRGPDFARTVDIHRKPGYDPLELFIDPRLRTPSLKIGVHLLRQRLGFHGLLDIIPLDASLVKGSHGRAAESALDGPLFITQQRDLVSAGSIDAGDVSALILQHVVPAPSLVGGQSSPGAARLGGSP